MTAQLSVKVTQCRIAINGLLMKGGKSSGGQVVKLSICKAWVDLVKVTMQIPTFLTLLRGNTLAYDLLPPM